VRARVHDRVAPIRVVQEEPEHGHALLVPLAELVQGLSDGLPPGVQQQPMPRALEPGVLAAVARESVARPAQITPEQVEEARVHAGGVAHEALHGARVARESPPLSQSLGLRLAHAAGQLLALGVLKHVPDLCAHGLDHLGQVSTGGQFYVLVGQVACSSHG
jgi:hypothetical protein